VSALDRELLAEKAAAMERHLARVAERLPAEATDLRSGTDSGDVVILHLWQAVQLVIDMALAACLQFNLGTPPSYSEAFHRLAESGKLDAALADRLMRAARFRNIIAHAYERLDMTLVHAAASEGPRDLRAFLAALRDHL
jgi:uncharacterized protein YutE (UPF0331/DUF86 family)